MNPDNVNSCLGRLFQQYLWIQSYKGRSILWSFHSFHGELFAVFQRPVTEFVSFGSRLLVQFSH